MLSKKSKGFFVEVSSFSILAATTSQAIAPCTIESVREYPGDLDDPTFRSQVEAMTPGKSARYVPSQCAIYPVSRFFRRHTLESAAKAKDPRYFPDLMSQQFRVEPSKNTAAVLLATSGASFDPEKPMTAQKELLIAGASNEEFARQQEDLVASRIYPESLELGTLACLGGLMDYLRWSRVGHPVLMLEITPHNSNLFVLNDGIVDLCRPIPYGLNSMFPIVQKELGLKDEESARKLFYSNTFDFTEMGPILMRKMLKELQASTGFYEVQTGQSIGSFVLTLLPRNLSWIRDVLVRDLGLRAMQLDYQGWLASRKVELGSGVTFEESDPRWLGLLSMIGNLATPKANGAQQEV
ncbi:MAG: hypothetical protein E1N59_2406 [Puniceicoccaceae bacterium 5H]|nr:MAG: hypothetical protein E1N59_2406 [Puniceicoccaceae bacterium 5H]